MHWTEKKILPAFLFICNMLCSFFLEPFLWQYESVLSLKACGWRWIQVAEGSEKTMRIEALQIDIDQREEKLMEFHWPMANCTVLHNQINVLSPFFFFSPFASLWGTFNAQTRSCRSREGGGAPEKCWQMYEKMFSGFSGLLAGVFDLQDWRMVSQGFGCRCIFLLWLQRECKKWRDSVMWKIMHRCCICFSRSERHFVFMQLMRCLYVLWPRSVVENIWLNLSGWFAIRSFKDKRAGSTSPTYNRHNKDDVRV